MKKYVLLVFIGLFAACSSGVRATRSAEQKLRVGGQFQYLYLPGDYDPSKQYPLVFCYHYPDSYRNFVGKYADERDVIFVILDGFDLKVYSYFTNHYSVDADRVYMTGWSAGGAGTFNNATRYPDLFAAVNPLFNGQSTALSVTYENELLYSPFKYHFMNLSALPVRMTPETLNFNPLIYFKYLERKAEQYDLTNFFIDFEHETQHTDFGMRQDFNNTLDFFLSRRRNRYPRRILYSSFYEKDALYYLNRIETVTNETMTMFSLRIDDGLMKIETCNVKSFDIAAEAFAELGYTNARIAVNGKFINLADVTVSNAAHIRVENPQWLDESRRNAESLRQTVTVKSLKSELFLSNTCSLSGRHVYTLRLISRSPFVLTLNDSQHIDSVVIGGKPANFHPLWDLPTMNRYYQIDVPEGANVSGDVKMEIVASGIVPEYGPETPLRNTWMMQFMAGYFEFGLLSPVPLPLNHSNPFPVEIAYDVWTTRPDELYMSGQPKTSLIASSVLFIISTNADGSSRYTYAGNLRPDADSPRIYYLNPGAEFDLNANGGLVRYYCNYSQYDKANMASVTNFIARECGRLFDVFGRNDPVTVIDNAAHFDYLIFDLQLVADRRMFNVSTDDYLDYSFFDNRSVTSSFLTTYFYSTTRDGIVPMFSYVFSFIFNGVNALPFLMSPCGNSSVEYLSILQNLITAFIPPSQTPSMEQVLFRWSLRRWMAWAILREDGYVAAHQFAGELDTALLLASRRKDTILPAASVTNFNTAYFSAPLGETMLGYAAETAGVDKLFGVIGKYRDRLFAAEHPFAELGKILTAERLIDFDISKVETAVLNGLPDIAVTAHSDDDIRGFRVAVEMTAEAAYPFPVEVIFYTNAVRESSRFVKLQTGMNRQTFTLASRPDYVTVNEPLCLIEPDAANNLAAIDDGDYCRAFTGALEDFLTNSQSIHKIAEAAVKKDVQKTYDPDRPVEGQVGLVKLFRAGPAAWIAVMQVNDKKFVFIFKERDNAVKLVSAAYY